MSKHEKTANGGGVKFTDLLERDVFDIADAVIEQAYPNIYGLEKGMWGNQRIPNVGILRGAIADVLIKERERANNTLLGYTRRSMEKNR